MREIKFRVWDSYNKEWCYETVQSICSANYFNDMSALCLPNSSCGDSHPEIFCQFTGLKDKNGKEIYEGDVINFTGIVTAPNDRFGKEWHEQCVVEFDSGCFKPFNAPYSNGKSAEIIGNIYEHPELLKRHC